MRAWQPREIEWHSQGHASQETIQGTQGFWTEIRHYWSSRDNVHSFGVRRLGGNKEKSKSVDSDHLGPGDILIIQRYLFQWDWAQVLPASCLPVWHLELITSRSWQSGSLWENQGASSFIHSFNRYLLNTCWEFCEVVLSVIFPCVLQTLHVLTHCLILTTKNFKGRRIEIIIIFIFYGIQILSSINSKKTMKTWLFDPHSSHETPSL